MTYLRNMFGKPRLSILFCIWMIQGLVSLWQFVAADYFKVALPYISIGLFLFLWAALNFIFIIFEHNNNRRWQAWKIKFAQPWAMDFLFLISSLVLIIRIGLWYIHGLLGQSLSLQIGGYLNILTPALNLIGYSSLEVVLIIVWVTLQQISVNFKFLKKFLFHLLVILFTLAALTAIVSKTRLGILVSYKGDWSRGLPAVALLEWQIVLASFLCLAMIVLEHRIQQLNIPHIELLICILVWSGACVLWLSKPVIPNASALKPHEPNYEIYPFIDSQTYDEAAQSILIGNGFGLDNIPQRPLYIEFLAFAHMLVGQNYDHVIFVQTLFFAFFPVLLYMLGRDLFGRPLGLSIALLAIVRDYTSNIVSPFTGNLSYSKLFLSEIPTAMFLILFLIIGIRWIKMGFPLYFGILLGGILGTTILIRTQAIVIAPLIILFSILTRPQRIKSILAGAVVMLFFTAIIATPWLWRNWKVTGDIVFDNPESQTMNLALRYSRVNGIDWQVERLPGETSGEFSGRLKKIALEAILSNPSGAAWALANSFVNHSVNNILLFPIRNEIKNSGELVFPSNAFWEQWEGTPTSSQSILLTFYIFLFGLGVTVAWQRMGWLGLLPLGLNFAYNLWTSIALLSGQRFMLTMDWSAYLYYMLGIFSLIGAFLFIINASRNLIVEWVRDNLLLSVAPEEHKNIGWLKTSLIGIFFFGIGLSLPLVEKIFPERYPQLSQRQLLATLTNSPPLEDSPIGSACFERLAHQGELSALQGRVLYPRYYSAGDGEDFTDTPGYKPVDQGRLVFDVIGQSNTRIIFPISTPPEFFPHASDVTLVYNQQKDLWFIFVSQGQIEKLYISDRFDRSLCD